MKYNFNLLFNDLVTAISTNNDLLLTNTIDKIIIYFNKIFNKNYQINHPTKKDIEKIGNNSFMFALENTINYNIELIRTIQNQIKTTKTSSYTPDYNDITYAMFIIDSTFHEFWHCKQYEDYINGILNEQTYLNSLSNSLAAFGQINYLDRSYEGEAYGNGISIMRHLCHDKSSNITYQKIYKKQMTEWNFFHKNSLFHEAIYFLDIIPFLKTNNGFENIIEYANKFIPLLNKPMRDALINRYPIISIGLKEKNNICQIKNPDELMQQYFTGIVKYQNNTGKLTSDERISLINIYIYLLIPQLNTIIYDDLCLKYGREKIEYFIKQLQKNINKLIEIYKSAYQKSITRIKKIRSTDKNILQDIDEDYATNKYLTAITYLESYRNKLELITNNKNMTN